MNIKILSKGRKRGTFYFNIVNFKTQEVYFLYFQFSLKDMWLIPHYEKEFSKLKMPLYGWLFFYFGRYSVGFVEKSSDNSVRIITDKFGNTYHLYNINEELRKDFRKCIKLGAKPRYNKETNEVIMEFTE